MNIIIIKFLYFSILLNAINCENFYNYFLFYTLVIITVGFVFKYIDRKILFIIMGIIMSISLATMPLSSYIWYLYLAGFLRSLGFGSIDSYSYVWIIEMWKQNYSPVLHLSQLMFGLGTVVGPLLAKPYLIGDITKLSDTSLNTTIGYMNTTINEDINYTIDRRSKLMIPFLIGGAITSLGLL